MGQTSLKYNKTKLPVNDLPTCYVQLKSFPDIYLKNDTQYQSQVTEHLQQKSDQCKAQKTKYKEQYKQLKCYVTLLNDFQLKSYANHLIYRNQPQFSSILRVPYGKVQSHPQSNYHKLILYTQHIKLRLNQINSINFYDMIQILYFSLIGFKYLYNYFGLFKIQCNMIGFTQNANVKVWINKKPIKDKYIPSQSDINLKRFKEEQSYMVDDLACIFWNKVDKQSVPQDFAFMKNTTIKQSRLSHSRISFKSQNYQINSSFNNSLNSANIFNDFSDASFDRSLQYIQKYFNFEDQNKLFTTLKKNLKIKNQIGSIKHLLKYGRQINQVNIYNMKNDHFIKSIDKIVKLNFKPNQATKPIGPKVIFKFGVQNQQQIKIKQKQKYNFSYQQPKQSNNLTQRERYYQQSKEFNNLIQRERQSTKLFLGQQRKLFLSQAYSKVYKCSSNADNQMKNYFSKEQDAQSLINELHSLKFDKQDNQNENQILKNEELDKSTPQKKSFDHFQN